MSDAQEAVKEMQARLDRAAIEAEARQKARMAEYEIAEATIGGRMYFSMRHRETGQTYQQSGMDRKAL